MYSWKLVSILIVAVIVLSNGHPVPDDRSSSSTTSTSSETSVAPSVFGDKGGKKANAVRSISTGENLKQQIQDPSLMITRALEDVSNTLGSSLKNIGHSAIQILEGTSVGVEQALGTGARIITGVAETVGEAAETGSKGAIRIAQGVAKSLSSGTKSLVDTKVGLLQGLTGGQIQADASTNAEAVQRNERAPQTGFGGYATGGYGGSNGVAETPGNFVNVFSQAAANTVNFGTQLLNSLVGVAANILQGLGKLYVDQFRNLVNTGSMITKKLAEIGNRLVVATDKAFQISLGSSSRAIQSTQKAATSFGSTLARTFGDTFGGLFQRISQAGAEGGSGSGSGSGGRLGLAGLSGSGGGLNSILSALSSIGGIAGGARDSSGAGSGTGNLLGGLGNFAQTLINAKLNLLNGILSPFTGGRPLLNFGRLGSGSSSSGLGSLSSSSGGYANAAASEPSFRISIAGTSSSPSSTSSSTSTTTSDSETNPRVARFYANPDVLVPVKPDAELNDANLRATFKNGVIKGLVDTLNSNLNRLGLNPSASKNNDLVGSFDNSGSFAIATPLVNKSKPVNEKKPEKETTQSTQSSAEVSDQQLKNSFSQLLPLTFAHQIGQLQQQHYPSQKTATRSQRQIKSAKRTL